MYENQSYMLAHNNLVLIFYGKQMLFNYLLCKSLKSRY